ncbi:MAG: VOC family protein [Fimbriiglobus sp.]
MTTITPYLFFAGQCEEALKFYTEHLGAQVDVMMKFSDSPEPIPEGLLQPGFEDKVLHASFSIRGVRILACDSTENNPKFEGFRLAMSVPTEAEAHEAFSALAERGTILMPLGKTFWSPCFGMLNDKFNIGWMIMVSTEPPSA